MLIEGMNKEKHDVPLLYPQATFCKGIFDFWQGFREGFMACASNTLNISGISLSISLKNAGGHSLHSKSVIATPRRQRRQLRLTRVV